MRIPFPALLDRIRSSLWFIPALMVLGGAVLSFVAVAADRRLIDAPGRTFLLYGGGADGARAVLGTVASSMMTVAGVVFSITIVALSLASQQFGPRVLRNFMEDRGNQIVLGTFLSTFVYCLLVVRTVRGGDDYQFVPHIAVTGAVFLSILSLGVLIYFIHHVSSSIRAEVVIARVAEELDKTIERLYPAFIGEEDRADDRWQVGSGYDTKTELTSDREGYLQAVDDGEIMEAAEKHDLMLRFDVKPGDFILRGQRLVEIDSRKVLDERLRDDLSGAFVLGHARTPVQDVEFPLHQLVQIAVRALSPGVNDPFTAMNAIDRIGAGLIKLSKRRFPSPVRKDEKGERRVFAPRKTFEEIARTALRPLHESAERSPVVVDHIARTLAGLTLEGWASGSSRSRGGNT